MALDVQKVRSSLELQNNWSTTLRQAAQDTVAFATSTTVSFDKAGAAVKKFESSAAGMAKSLDKIGLESRNAGMALSAGLTAPLLAIGGGALKAAIDFESSFAGVRKTVNATKPELDAMAMKFRDLAKTIPVNVNELNRLGEAAGALGIPKAEIVDFTAVMAKLGVTTNLTSDEAADSIAKIQNIFGSAGVSTDRFASALVALGNDGASTEREIAALANRFASAGNAAGLSQAQVLGYSSALANVGIEAEAGGTAISKVFNEISLAALKGGDDLKQFADIAKIPMADFATLMKNDAAVGVQKFIEGLNRMNKEGQSLALVIDNLGITEVRQANALRSLALSGDNLAKSLATANKGWQENTALSKEAAERFKTTEQQLVLLWNRVKDVGITLGGALLPALRSVMDAVSGFIPLIEKAAQLFANLPQPIQTVVIAVAGIAAAAGPLLFLFGGMASGIASLLPLLARLAPAITSVGTAAAGSKVLVSGFVAGLAGIVIPLALERVVELFKQLKGYYLDSKGWTQDIANEQAVHNRMLEEASRVAKRLVTDVAEGQQILRENAARLQFELQGGIVKLKSLGGVAISGVSQGVTKAAEDTLGFTKAIQEADKALAGLSKNKMTDLVAGIKGGFGMEQLQKQSGLSELAINRLKDRIEATTKSTKTAGDEWEKMQEKMKGAVEKMQEESRQTNAMILEVANTAITAQNRMQVAEATANRILPLKEATADAARWIDVWTKGLPIVRGVKDILSGLGETLEIPDIKLPDIAMKFKIRESLAGAFAEVPKLMADAFTGGGNAAGAFKALGVTFADAIARPMIDKLKGVAKEVAQLAIGIGQTIGSAIGGALGGAGGAQVAGVAGGLAGAAASSGVFGAAIAGSTVAIAGLTAGVGAAAVGIGLLIKKFTDNAGRDAIKKWVDQFGGFSGFEEKMKKFGAAGQDMWVKITQGVGRNNPEQAARNIELVEQRMKSLENQMGDANASLAPLLDRFLALGQQVPAALQPLIDALTRTGALSEENAFLLAQFQETGVPSVDAVREAAARYGLTLEDLGRGTRQLDITERAEQIVADFKLIERAGGDLVALMAGAKDKIQAVVTEALAFGLTLPESMRGLIESMITAGDLTDEFGNKLMDTSRLTFAETLEKQIGKLVDRMGDLIDALTGVGSTAEAQFNRARRAAEELGKAVPKSDNAGSGNPPTEATPAPTESSPSEQATRRGGGTVIVEASGRVLAELTVPEIPGVVERYGIGTGA